MMAEVMMPYAGLRAHGKDQYSRSEFNKRWPRSVLEMIEWGHTNAGTSQMQKVRFERYATLKNG